MSHTPQDPVEERVATRWSVELLAAIAVAVVLLLVTVAVRLSSP